MFRAGSGDRQLSEMSCRPNLGSHPFGSIKSSSAALRPRPQAHGAPAVCRSCRPAALRRQGPEEAAGLLLGALQPGYLLEGRAVPGWPGSRTTITDSPSSCAYSTFGVSGAKHCPGRGCCLATGDPAGRGGRCCLSVQGAGRDSFGNGLLLPLLLPLNLHGYVSEVPAEETVSK